MRQRPLDPTDRSSEIYFTESGRDRSGRFRCRIAGCPCRPAEHDDRLSLGHEVEAVARSVMHAYFEQHATHRLDVCAIERNRDRIR